MAWDQKLTKEERHNVILKALEPGVNISELAREHGLNRNTIYGLIRPAVKNPHKRLQEAEEEVRFLRQVCERVG
jgi:transposase-like protein